MKMISIHFASIHWLKRVFRFWICIPSSHITAIKFWTQNGVRRKTILGTLICTLFNIGLSLLTFSIFWFLDYHIGFFLITSSKRRIILNKPLNVLIIHILRQHHVDWLKIRLYRRLVSTSINEDFNYLDISWLTIRQNNMRSPIFFLRWWSADKACHHIHGFSTWKLLDYFGSCC